MVGSPSRVRDQVAAYAKGSGTGHLVVSFAWGDLAHDEVLRSLDLFVEHAMAPVPGPAG